ncbi:MAG: exodeoxyribonuclease III [Fimbriimonas sp.]
MKVVTFNAASVRARLPLLVEWIAENEPDVLAIQETKVEDDKFPRAEFEELGYEIALHGQKSWNGVATLSRSPIVNVRQGFMDEMMPTDARVLTCEIDGIPIINTYVPNGNTVGSDKFEYKLRWLDRFRRFLDENFRPDHPLIWLGDINVAPQPEDVYDSKRFFGGIGHHPEEMARLEKIVDFGLTDLFRLHTQGPNHYTFWDFTLPRGVDRNLGWRIDHIYATAPLAGLCTACTIDKFARTLPKPSDHTFVTATFDL